jgi:hypothetical protein
MCSKARCNATEPACASMPSSLMRKPARISGPTAKAASHRNASSKPRLRSGLSKPQLAARLGIDSADVEAYERGEKRMSCKLLLEAAKQLKATPRFFFS